ncbi:MAG: metalloregulator ArsR/SmtB family transcription factor [Nanoarchaeota archaeon]|nr:metalloregulator ArsR/SmtB family transcription factor [Nanoarchaeota archaeon]MBU1622916.1 metalloregulator ArsR/SmtB family transcription factor [Nanoarchaeota archaeon]MBU1974386.1 metalloregulator ArsR/SmtB family transcription factor [Nanoarchaeota archaeon]
MKCQAVESFFVNFANKTKLDIILCLKEKPLSVNDLAKELNEEQSKISHNLKKLTECNILMVKQKGKQRIYSLNQQTVIPLLKLVEKHVQSYCRGKCKK